MLNQQNLQKQLEEKMSDLEQRLLDAATDTGGPGEELEELKSSNEFLHAAQAEQDDLIKDLESRVCFLSRVVTQSPLFSIHSPLSLQPFLLCGRAASEGALAPEPPRATCNQPEPR